MDPLAALSRRFNLEDQKSYMCHDYNIISNWNLIHDQPPPAESYINPFSDDQAAQLAKRQWHQDEKMMEPFFSFNDDVVRYCILDVDVHLQSLCKFLADSFTFQDLLLERFGPSPSASKKAMPYFHLFGPGQATIGSFR